MYFYLQTRTDGNTTCLPREYPRINDCEAPEVSVRYTDRINKTRNKEDEKDENDKKNNDDDNEKKNKDKDEDNNNKKNKKKKKGADMPPCNTSALIFAVPKFKISGFYDPCEALICSGNSLKLALSLLMVPFINTLFRIY